MKMETLKQQILTAKGDVRAELVLKNAAFERQSEAFDAFERCVVFYRQSGKM